MFGNSTGIAHDCWSVPPFAALRLRISPMNLLLVEWPSPTIVLDYVGLLTVSPSEKVQCWISVGSVEGSIHRDMDHLQCQDRIRTTQSSNLEKCIAIQYLGQGANFEFQDRASVGSHSRCGTSWMRHAPENRRNSWPASLEQRKDTPLRSGSRLVPKLTLCDRSQYYDGRGEEDYRQEQDTGDRRCHKTKQPEAS